MTRLAIELSDTLVDAVAERVAELLADRQAPAVEDGWLTVGEAAEYLRCPKSRLYALCSAERVPHVKDGSRTLFRRSELDQWLRDGGGRRP